MIFDCFEGKLGKTIIIMEDAAIILYVHDDKRIQQPEGKPVNVELIKLACIICENFDFWWIRLQIL